MGPTIILIAAGLPVLAVVLWPALRNRRANARFQRSIRVYDETRRARILAGEDPRRIPTAEEELVVTGHGRMVRSIERLPLPDPIPPLPPVPTATLEPPTEGPFPERDGAQAKTARHAGQRPAPRPEPTFSSRVTQDPTPEPAAVDPFLALMAEQAKADRVVKHRPPRRSKRKPPKPMYPPVGTPAPPAARRRYMLTYATGWGEVTEREIRFKRAYMREGEVYVEAFCFLRGEERTFRADRMVELYDRENSVRIANPLGYFRATAD